MYINKLINYISKFISTINNVITVIFLFFIELLLRNCHCFLIKHNGKSTNHNMLLDYSNFQSGKSRKNVDLCCVKTVLS